MSTTTVTPYFTGAPIDKDQLFAALSAAQSEFEAVAKANEADTGSYKYRYADLADIVTATKGILKSHGLSVTQFPSGSQEAPTLITYLCHESGQYLMHAMPLFLAKKDPQGQGSAITYARRYAYCAVLGIVADVDDDGQRAVTAISEEAQALAAEQEQKYQTAMAKATELRAADGDDGRYMAELKARANEAGFNLVGQWARANPDDVYAAAEEYLGIVGELKAQEAPVETPEPVKAARKRAPARAKPGSAVQPDDPGPDAAAAAIESLKGAFPGAEEVPDAPDGD